MPADPPPASWRERFVDASPIRALGSVETIACRTIGGARRVLLAARADAPPGETSAMLADIARVHRLIDHRLVARVAEVDDENAPTWIAFDCDAVVDFDTLTEVTIDHHLPFDHGGAAAFALELLELLDVTHKIIDPESSAPVCIGAFSCGNVLASESGRLWHFGWGHPRGTARARLLADMPQSFLAPETLFGIPPSPGSDLAASAPFFHSFYRAGEWPPLVRACLEGRVADVPRALIDLVFSLMQNAQAARPEDRSIPRFVIDLRATCDILGLTTDLALFKRDLVNAIETWRASSAGPLRFALARDGRWLKLSNGEVVSLERRGATRRLLLALAVARRDAPGGPLSWETLLEAGWPGENPGVEAARNRVYVAVAGLRSLGLRDLIVRTDAGYFIDPSVVIEWSDDPSNRS